MAPFLEQSSALNTCGVARTQALAKKTTQGSQVGVGAVTAASETDTKTRQGVTARDGEVSCPRQLLPCSPCMYLSPDGCQLYHPPAHRPPVPLCLSGNQVQGCHNLRQRQSALNTDCVLLSPRVPSLVESFRPPSWTISGGGGCPAWALCSLIRCFLPAHSSPLCRILHQVSSS